MLVWKKGFQSLIYVFLIFNILLSSVSCSKQPESDSTTASSDAVEQMDSAGDMFVEVDLCDLGSDWVGKSMRTEGTITFLNHASSDRIYFDLDDDGCLAGVWLDKASFEGLEPEKQSLLAMGSNIFVEGSLSSEGGEFFIECTSFGKPTTFTSQLDPTEKWWLKLQTYHEGESPENGSVPIMNITALHDWTSMFWMTRESDEPYWSTAAIQERWNDAHRQGMRVEVVLSIVDMWYVEIGPEDAVYEFAGIDLNGDHIEYQDPIGFVGCTNQHGWQEYLKESMQSAVDMGVDGFIIDDYEGTSRWSSGIPSGLGGWENGPGGCFCADCETGFREFLKTKYSPEELANFGIEDIDTFDYSDYLLERGWTVEKLGDESVKFAGWDAEAEITAPLYQDYADFQNQEIITFTKDLKETILNYTKEKYNKEISWSINKGEQAYGSHKYQSYFDRNIGGIHYFGYPPKGTEGYYYRLEFDIYGAPRLREVPRSLIVVAVMNEYDANNLWTIKDAEAYANKGALIENDYFIIEGESDEKAAEALHTDPEVKFAYNTFYLANDDVFDFTSTNSMAKVAVVYSSPSVKNDMFRHIYSFNGISEILTDLHVQFDPIFIGDGVAYEDNLSKELVENYEAVILPNVFSLTEKQVNTILGYVNYGGTVLAMGEFGVTDENGENLEIPELSALKGQRLTELGEGKFYHLWVDVYRADAVADWNTHGPASAYFTFYIENNHPGVEKFLSLEDEEPIEHISDETAASIRDEISLIIDESISSRVVLDTFSENIGIQAYIRRDSPQKIFLHLINYEYELETDKVFDQENIPVAIELPDGFDVSTVSVISPDFDQAEELDFSFEEGYLRFTVPYLHIWDVIVVK